MADGNSIGPQNSGTTGGDEGYVSAEEFIEELDREQLQLHLMNNSEIREAAQEYAEKAIWQTRHEEFRQQIGEIYGDPDLTLDEVDWLDIPNMGPVLTGTPSKNDARHRIVGRDDALRRYQNAETSFEQRVETEMRTVVETFRDLAIVLNGNSEDSVSIRQQIADADSSVETFVSGVENVLAELRALETEASNMSDNDIYNAVHRIAQEFDDWIIQNDNPYIVVHARTDYSRFVWGIHSLDGNSIISRFRHELVASRDQTRDVQNFYPEEYKQYNSLMSGFHLTTWSEFWWILATTALWMIAEEILFQIAAFALVPLTAGASVAVINAAAHVRRTRHLGRIVSAFQDARAVRAAVAAGSGAIAIARWLLELPDRVLTFIFNTFDDVVRRVLGLQPRVRPSPDGGADVDGPEGRPVSTNCPNGVCAAL